jgi:2-methylcitrate dehydratase PrpD
MSGDRHTRALARFCAALSFDELPREVVSKAKLCILDTLGCCFFGASLPPVRMLAAVAAAERAAGTAAVIGTPLRTSAALAALVNGSSAHAFHLDDIHLESSLHPGALALPVALALAEGGDRRAGVSGRDFIVALVAGYELGIRVGLAAKGGMLEGGFHNQGTTGVFVAAATAARMLRLDPVQTQHVLGIAGSQAAGLMAAQDAAATRSFHCGRAAQSGVYAAQLAARGYTGIPDVLDGAYGTFFSAFLQQSAAEPLTEGLGTHWHTLRVGFKPAPAANGCITAMTAIDKIMRAHRLVATDIIKVTAFVSESTLHHCGWPYEPERIRSVLSAQMSLRYGIAVMALDRNAGAAQFQESRIRAPDILDFVSRIGVEHEPQFEGEDGRYRVACRLRVKCRKGTEYEAIVRYRKGSPEDPMSEVELMEKFLGLTRPSAGDRARQIAPLVAQIETCDDLSTLSPLLTVGADEPG